MRDLDAAEVWDTLVAGRRGLVRFVRGLLGGGVLNPDTLTIGFARRFATYKRATLLLSQPERLMALLNDADRPVQFVFAGKAHPADTPGKELIQKIEQFARKADVRHRFVFLADYDMAIAREMYHGCDVWLNTPRRPLEACGTSGMKAALNGALNCSILDGWWDECYAAGHRLGDRVGRRRPRPRAARPARVRQPVRGARGAGGPAVLRAHVRRPAAGVGGDGPGGVGDARPAGHRGPDGPRLHHGAVRAGGRHVAVD